jgi:hypothetical protein
MEFATLSLVFYTLWSAKCMSSIDLGWTCNLWFFAAKFECEVFTIFPPFLHGLLFFYPPCFKCNFLAMHHACNVFCKVRVWTWFEAWTMNILCEVWVGEVRGSLVAIVVSKAFSFIDFVISYVLSLVVCNVNPSLSLAALIVSKAFSFVDPYVSNVLSFTI